VRQIEIELTVGDVVQLGDQLLTVVDIDDNGQVTFRVDPVEPNCRPRQLSEIAR